MKLIFTAIFSVLFSAQLASAATVNCTFLKETTISTNGEWLKSEMDFMKLYNLFGDGLSLPLANSLLANLDTQMPFLAGEVDRGKVYLMGSDAGVEGKLIGVQNEQLTIYDGFCTVGFG